MDQILDNRCLRRETMRNAHQLAKTLEAKSLPITSRVWGECVRAGRSQAELNPSCSTTSALEDEALALLETLVAALAATKTQPPA